jgi:hypothetical protein
LARLNIRWPETLSAFGAIFNVVAAYYSFQVSDKSVQLTVRQTEYQNYLQRPQLSVIGEAIIPIGINSENVDAEMFGEKKVTNYFFKSNFFSRIFLNSVDLWCKV